MTALSGLRCFESWEKFSQLGSLAKTLLASSIWHSPSVYLTWRASVTRSKCLIFRLVESEPPTDAIASGLLPTPTAQEYGSGQNGQRGDGTTFKQAGKPSLSTMARRNLIPTPTTGDSEASGSRNTASSNAHAGISLKDWARQDGGKGRLIPTPDANCWKGGKPDQRKSQLNGRLNPRFVEQMMGFPTGWTDLEP